MSLPTLDGDSRERGKGNNLPKMNMSSLDEHAMPSLEDNDFEELTVEQALYESKEDEENKGFYDDIEEDEIETELPNIKRERQKELASEDDYYPEYEEEKLENNHKFIDKKKMLLIPFGGKKSKRNKKLIKSSDFDDRKNKLAKTKLIQFLIISTIILLFFIGLKNTFAPSHVYTSDQIKEIAKEGSGQTSFPNERGKVFAENFMLAYLTFDRSKPELSEMVQHYYGGKISGNAETLNMNWSNSVKQNVIIPPKVEAVEFLSDYSARYELSAYVSNVNGESVVERELDGRWLSFSVNVYYDEDDKTMSITQDSPTMIPYKRIGKVRETPESKKLGNGTLNKDILPALTPTIDGFIEAYGKSSYESHNSIVQYISDTENISLYDGFGGEVELNGRLEDSIIKEVYNTDKEGVYETLVTVHWKDAVSTEESAIAYTSRYKMTIVTDSGGKYLVSEFEPAKYYK